jgi:hypothetical protein
MPKKTYTQINSVTLAASSSSVTFSSIPQNFRDLILVYLGTTGAVSGVEARVNGDSASNYSLVRMYSGGGGTGSTTATTNYYPVMYSGLPVTGMSILQIMDYSTTDKHKTALTRGSEYNYSMTEALASRWANTAAITSLSISSSGFNSGSTFILYGIEA